VNHVRTASLLTPDGIIANATTVFTGDGEVAYDGVIAASVEAQVAVAFDHTKIKSLVFFSDQLLSVAVNAPSGGSPATTFAVPAGVLRLWAPEDLTNDPFTVNVTSLYITNSGATDATIRLRVLLDVTP
jgi:hypothetical protein